jgi:hypothetical protein
LQHEAVAAECNNDVGLVAAGVGVTLAKRLQGALRFRCIRCDEVKGVCQLIPL